VLHCFSGDEQVVGEAGARGYFLSFAGNVTYPSAGPLRAAMAAAPDGQVLVETDSPFLTPQSVRGTPNAPANVLEILTMVASVRGLNLDAMVRLATEASFRVFPLPR
jgi:TatD DNase family protein